MADLMHCAGLISQYNSLHLFTAKWPSRDEEKRMLIYICFLLFVKKCHMMFFLLTSCLLVIIEEFIKLFVVY